MVPPTIAGTDDENAGHSTIQRTTVDDIVGLYLNPPEAAVVLCIDEKTLVQALEPSAPPAAAVGDADAGHPRLPPARHHRPLRRPRRRLALVVGDLTERHRSEEIRRVLILVDRSVP